MLLTSVENLPEYKKIISLVPSQTELLYHLNLDDKVIGITKFCIHPQEWLKKKKKVGGTKTLNIELIKQLQPDLVIANKEENEKAQIEVLINYFDVWLTDVRNLQDAFSMINDIGHITDRTNAAGELIDKIKNEFSYLKDQAVKKPAAYFIWRNPYLVVGGDTFINDMMNRCGLNNIFSERKRYPEIILEELKIADCQLILLSSEPYPFKPKHIHELEKFLPGKKILLVDGEIFSWYGSRLQKAPGYFKHLVSQF